MQKSIVFLVRVQFRRKESSRSLSHLLMSFLYVFSERRYMSSPVRLSVTLVHPTQAIEIFGDVSTPFGTLVIC